MVAAAVARPGSDALPAQPGSRQQQRQGGCVGMQHQALGHANEQGVSPGIASAVAKLRALKAARAAAAAAAAAATADHEAPGCDSSSGIMESGFTGHRGSGTGYSVCAETQDMGDDAGQQREHIAAVPARPSEHAMDGWHSHRSHSSIHTAPCSGHSTARRHRDVYNADPCRPSHWNDMDNDWAAN
jgi:hypothetical protein